MKQTGAAAARPQEPSMEEILASIRRIIADDGEPEPPEPPRPVRAAPPAPPPTPQPDEKGQAFDLAAPSRSLQPPMPKLDGADLPVLDEAAKALDVEPAHKPEPTPPRQPEEPPRAPLSPEALLSGEANAHVSRAFNRLATTVLTNNARTLALALSRSARTLARIARAPFVALALGVFASVADVALAVLRSVFLAAGVRPHTFVVSRAARLARVIVAIAPRTFAICRKLARAHSFGGPARFESRLAPAPVGLLFRPFAGRPIFSFAARPVGRGRRGPVRDVV